jgi:hypothetical protein
VIGTIESFSCDLIWLWNKYIFIFIILFFIYLKKQPRQPDGRPMGQIKGYSQDIFTEEKESEGSSLLKHEGQEVASQRKSIMVKKKERLL